jgi:hypothetical protein
MLDENSTMTKRNEHQATMLPTRMLRPGGWLVPGSAAGSTLSSDAGSRAKRIFSAKAGLSSSSGAHTPHHERS